MHPPPPLHEVNKFLLLSFCMSSYCVQQTKILTSEGHVFYRELAFRLLEVLFCYPNILSCPSYGLLTKNYKNYVFDE